MCAYIVPLYKVADTPFHIQWSDIDAMGEVEGLTLKVLTAYIAVFIIFICFSKNKI